MRSMSLTIKQINELRAYAKDRKGELAKLIADAADTIEVLSAKQPEPKWIPCSERLPEKTQLCLVTEKTVVGFEVCTRCFNKRNDGGFWSGWGHTDVIAWMPLPEPLREEGEKRMRKVTIKRNTDGDTRVAKTTPNFYNFKKSNEQHREDVRKMMCEIANDINMAGANHDYTKVDRDTGSLFYRELCNTIEGRMNFEDGKWYKMHCETERHHLNEHCPDDVNLIDVIEMICDCVCAGMARSGSVYPIEISSDVLQKAVSNTVEMCVNAVDIEEGD